MNFYLIGLDYKSASPEIRQSLYRQRSQIENFWKNVAALDTAILVTCNRFDISIAAREEKDIFASLELFKKEFPEFYAQGYVKQDKLEVLAYGLRLACGLESQLRGEFQILEQLGAWISQDKFPASLLRFWNQIFRSAVEIRHKTGLYSRDINIARLLFEDLNDLHPENEKLEIAILGTGKVAGLLAEYKTDHAQFSFVAHKNRLKAEILANRAQGKVLSFAQFKKAITGLDVLVAAASSPHIILKPEDVSELIAQRKRPLYIYDLGFPVNVAKELGYRKNIILKNIDDLVNPAKNTGNYLYGNFNLAEYLIEETVARNDYAQSRYASQPASH